MQCCGFVGELLQFLFEFCGGCVGQYFLQECYCFVWVVEVVVEKVVEYVCMEIVVNWVIWQLVEIVCDVYVNLVVG